MAQKVGTASRRTAPEPGPVTADRPAHVVRRRRGLPGTRAVVGGLLVAAAAVGLFAAASGSSAGPRRSYVVARHELPAGARLEASDLALAPMDLSPTLRDRAFEGVQPLLDATLVSPLGAGELVQASAVVARRSGASSRELSFTLERGAVGAGIKQGERADLLATYGTGNEAFTVVVVRQALLVTIERPRASAGDGGPTTVTVAVDEPTDAIALAHALQLGKITLVRATGAPPLAGVPPTYRTGRS